jgi:hypothetical protein
MHRAVLVGQVQHCINALSAGHRHVPARNPRHSGVSQGQLRAPLKSAHQPAHKVMFVVASLRVL